MCGVQAIHLGHDFLSKGLYFGQIFFTLRGLNSLDISHFGVCILLFSTMIINGIFCGIEIMPHVCSDTKDPCTRIT